MKKLSCHCNVTNSKAAGYPYLESIKSFANLCGEVVVVDGGTTDGSLEEIAKIGKVKVIQGKRWQRDFDWKIMAENLQIGYENCSGDWVFHFDVDYIFHEKNVDKLREIINKVHTPAIELKKVNFILSGECFAKEYLPFLLNKKEYPSLYYGFGRNIKGIKTGSTLIPIAEDNSEIESLHREDIEVYTYDFTFMTKEQVVEQRVRFVNSLRRFAKREGKISKDSAFRDFVRLRRQRYKLYERKKVKIRDHSRFIRGRIKNIKPNMFGYNMWGMYLEN